MTVQVPERIILDDKPYYLHAQPLYRLLRTRRARFSAPDGVTTACHRQYVATWTLMDGGLWLVGLSTCGCEELPLSDEMRAWFLHLVPAPEFPIRADWFSGRLRIPTGPMLGPLAWITDDDYEHLRGDWWPPDWPAPNIPSLKE